MVSITTGIDIVEVKRFRDIPFEEKEDFYKKNFDSKEIKYCLKFKDPYSHFAGKFAVKEAVIKSIDTKENFSNIITYHQNKKPIVSISVKNEYEFSASISHEKDY